MIAKLRVQFLVSILLLVTFLLQACVQPSSNGIGATQEAGNIPTWTPRPQDLTPFPTSTPFATLKPTDTATPAFTDTPAPTPTLKLVTYTAVKGNVNVRRGPGLEYNPIQVLYDGQTAQGVGRDRISRWILVELSSPPGVRGWVTTETQYAKVEGDVSILPFVKAEPANPAFIRNCTKHTMLILPNDVQLLDKYNKPYNEDRFNPGFYDVYDTENPKNVSIQTIDLAEGRTVDIRYDWTGDKSKCE